MKIDMKTSIGLENVDDCDAYVTRYDITISGDDWDESRIGEAAVSRLHVALVDDGDRLLEGVLSDLGLEEWQGLTSVLGNDASAPFVGVLEGKIDGLGDILLIEDIRIDEDEYKGKGIELLVLNRVLDTLGEGCAVVFYYYGAQDFEVPKYLVAELEEAIPEYLYKDLSLCKVDANGVISIQKRGTRFEPLLPLLRAVEPVADAPVVMINTSDLPTVSKEELDLLAAADALCLVEEHDNSGTAAFEYERAKAAFMATRKLVNLPGEA